MREDWHKAVIECSEEQYRILAPSIIDTKIELMESAEIGFDETDALTGHDEKSSESVFGNAYLFTERNHGLLGFTDEMLNFFNGPVCTRRDFLKI